MRLVPTPLEWILRDALSLLALTAVLWLFHLYGRTLPTVVLAAAWGLLTAAIAGTLVWRRRVRRRAFLAVYLTPDSPLQRWLRGGWVLAVRQVPLAAVLSLLLAVALLRLREAAVWVVLIGAVPILVLTQAAVRQAAAGHVSRPYLAELSWRLSLWGVGAAMLGVLVALAMYRPYPELGGVGLEGAVWHLVDQENARSAAASTLLEMAAAKDALRLWLAQQLMPQPGGSLVQLLGWLLVVAEEGLFVWSYLLVCNGLLIGVNAHDRADG